MTIHFTAPSAIQGIMIGPPCVLPGGYGYNNCFPYFVYDDFYLTGLEFIGEISVNDFGSPCEQGYSLFAEVNDPGQGTWQWYWNGVAIVGQNEMELLLANNSFQSGTYQVTYSNAYGCLADSISVLVPPNDTTDEFVFFCPMSTVDCAGEIFSAPGEYEVSLTNYLGCDSIVNCIVQEYVVPQATELTYILCYPDSVDVCDEVLTSTDDYEIICKDYHGCDSVVHVDLRLLSPFALVQIPLELQCGPNSTVIIDGSNSNECTVKNGITFYQWSGPPNGIIGPSTNNLVEVQSTGNYCLILSHESDGVSCSDTACVEVISAGLLPDLPNINGNIEICSGGVFEISVANGGPDPISGYIFSYDPSLNVSFVNDSTFQYLPASTGQETFCISAYNECGEGPTNCLDLIVHDQDTTTNVSFTCDPAQAGILELNYFNQFGCDSLVYIERIFVPEILINIDEYTCNPQAIGTDTLVYISYFGCDSLVVRTRLLAPSPIITNYIYSCYPDDVGSDTLILQTFFNCDSTIITKTDLLPSQEKYVTLFTCDQGQEGVDTLVLTNIFGCDSLIFIETIYSGKYQKTQYVIQCGIGSNYSDTTIVTSGPCDSLFITAFQFHSPDTTWLTDGTCDPGQVGLSQSLQTNQWGCDSLILTQINLFQSDTTLIYAMSCDPFEAGVTSMNLTNQDGCDSIVTTITTFVGQDTQYVVRQTCDPAQAGSSTEILQGTYCDSVIVTETILVPAILTLDTLLDCNHIVSSSDTLTYTSTSGCDSLVITFRVGGGYMPELEVVDETCAGADDGGILIPNISGGSEPFQYRLGQGPWQLEPLFAGLTPGVFAIDIKDANGCIQVLTGIVVEGGQEVEVDAGPDREVVLGDLVTIAAQSFPSAFIWQWIAMDGLDCQGCSTVVLGPVTAGQDVRVTVVTPEGCTGMAIVHITLAGKPDHPVKMFIPNSFTPNGDGINDVFSIYGNDQVVRVRNLAVYDRWGNALYARSDLEINDPSSGWDGTFREKLMDPGVYVYVVEVELVDGKVRLYKGDVTITR
ncbi:MAG: gliding motility-associated C-terminal domain-containing protein [Saprospiraceae bacterium]|nr:gliding motility-associated C-terminal domain-containing protein [Saprospiraceae bacterium]